MTGPAKQSILSLRRSIDCLVATLLAMTVGAASALPKERNQNDQVWNDVAMLADARRFS
jgi:hypothetical protein